MDRLTDAGALGPVDPLQNLRALGLAPLLSSEGLEWRGIEVGHYRYPLREAEQPPFENHLIALVMRPFRFERHRDGRVDDVFYKE